MEYEIGDKVLLHDVNECYDMLNYEYPDIGWDEPMKDLVINSNILTIATIDYDHICFEEIGYAWHIDCIKEKVKIKYNSLKKYL